MVATFCTLPVSKELSFNETIYCLLTCFITSMNNFIAVIYRSSKSLTKYFNATLELLRLRKGPSHFNQQGQVVVKETSQYTSEMVANS